MQLFTSLVVSIILGCLHSVYGQNFIANEYQFENLADTDVGDNNIWVWRSQAKNQKTLRLQNAGQHSVILTLCPTPVTPGQTVEAFIANMRYSNDGASDVITASVDGQKIGSFETVPIWARGNHWNVFYETGRVGHNFSMQEGKYKMTIDALTDMYGVEIDKINIKTWNQKPGVDIICGVELGVNKEEIVTV